jgi:hypothetical protein
MAKARRTPPLFEVLSGSERRSPPGTLGNGSRPVEVRVPAGPGPNIDTGAPRPAPERPRPAGPAVSPVLWVLVAIALAAVAATGYFAFRAGEDKAARSLVPVDPGLPRADSPSGPGAPDTPSGPATPPGETIARPDNPADPGPGAQRPGPTPPAPPAPEPDPGDVTIDPRQPGMNYLHIVKLRWRDAEKAVAFLNASGVPVAAVPERQVDPSTARDNNLPHLVFALEAIPSDRFTASADKRKALIEKVKRIGQRFQREHKGVSDFSEPFWARYQSR